MIIGTVSKRQRVKENDDRGERIRPCPECGEASLWEDRDLGQKYCLGCGHYEEDPNKAAGGFVQ